LTTLTGTQALLLVASETGHVYTFATPKLQPFVTLPEGKSLIQACLNSPDTLPVWVLVLLLLLVTDKLSLSHFLLTCPHTHTHLRAHTHTLSLSLPQHTLSLSRSLPFSDAPHTTCTHALSFFLSCSVTQHLTPTPHYAYSISRFSLTHVPTP
jgi:hypothetical protein